MLSLIEHHAYTLLTGPYAVADFRIAHGLPHVQRVCRHALRLAQAEGYPHADRVAAAALLHDIGLAVVEKRGDHPRVGAEMATHFLAEHALFPPAAIDEIAAAIAHHGRLDGDAPLIHILRDADILDLLGVVGIMRAFSSKHMLPTYDPANPLGDTWGLSAVDFTARFQARLGVGPTAIDQINFQLSCADNLRTKTAKARGRSLTATMRSYLRILAIELA